VIWREEEQEEGEEGEEISIFLSNSLEISDNMLEGPSYLVSRDLRSSCEQERKWIYNKFRVIELSNSNFRLEDGEELPLKKSCNVLSNSNCHFEDGEELPLKNYSCNALSNTKRRLEDGEEVPLLKKSCNVSDTHEGEGLVLEGFPDIFLVPADHQPDDQQHTGHQSDSSSLIHQLGRDISINCIIRCSRSDYGSIASLNQSFRSLIRSGELYRLRQQMGIIEHWVYFSCSLLEWEAFDPSHDRRRMHLPRMPSNECFMWSGKESLAVGTDLLVFGKEITSHVIYRYSILTNRWSSGMRMNTSRCLFGSASLGEIAILAGGCDPHGNILDSAELYNSETGTWVTLPNMNKARKKCSGVFMDGKFYVIGGIGIGIGIGNSKSLTCGEVYDLKEMKWTVIPDMFVARNGGAEAPPLVAVVNNELYAANYAQKEVRRYDKERNLWVTIGRLPEQAVSMNGWGLAFRACGHRLIVIGGPRALGEGMIELNSWVPNEGPPQWDLLATKQCGSFVYNCAVMGC
jgi:hypothetical protein